MKLLKVSELSGALLLVLLPKLFCSAEGWVDVEQKDTVAANNGNDVDVYNGTSGSGAASDIHSRAKRFIAFPVGSSFSTAVCLTTGVIGNPNYQYLSMGLNWGIAYDLPNSTWVLEHAKGFGSKDDKGTQIKRRHRRDLYGKLETLMIGDLVKYSMLGNSTVLDVRESVATVGVKDIPAGNNSSAKNQIIFETLQRKLHVEGNDLLSVATCATRSANNASGIVELPTDKLAASNASSTLSATATSLEYSPSSPSSTTASAGTSLQQRLLSRPKRYLSFPEGSSFSVAVCFTVGIIGNPRYNYMSFGLNWGVAYDLPNTSWILNHLHGFAKRPIPVAMWHRRYRRALYTEIESFVDNMGYNGRDCVLRALCESRQYFQNIKMGMIGEMLRAIFSLPKKRIYRRESEEHSDMMLYDRAYRKARSLDMDMDCSAQYDCSFSLLELAFGKYSTPPPGYYEHH